MSQLSKAPGTVNFMPPEVMFDNPQYGTPIDVFSFACVSLHTITHKWPSPTAPVYIDPRTNALRPRSEAERRASYLDMFCNEALFLKPLLLDCLEYNPTARPSVVEVCKKLEMLKGPNYQPPLPNLLETSDDTDCGISLLQLDSDERPTPAFGYWRSLEKVWESCADLPSPELINSVTQIDVKVYVTGNQDIFCYSLHEDSWSTLPPLPVYMCSLARIVSTKQLLAIGGISQLGISNQALLWDAAERCWRDDRGMTVARYAATAVDYHSSVIVLGGQIDNEQSTTQSVEVLQIVLEDLGASQWYTVQSIPFAAFCSMTIIVDDTLYVAGGFMLGAAVSYMTSVSIPSLLSSNNHTGNMWSDISHLPCTTSSFASYKDRLVVIIFSL